MRFILIALFWVVLVGGVWIYTSSKSTPPSLSPVREVTSVAAGHDYSIRATPTFSAEKDPFALEEDSEGSIPIEIHLNGVRLPVNADTLGRGEQIGWDSVKGVLVGQNEIYVKASPPVAESHLDHGVRLVVLQDQILIADKTIWGTKGALVSGTFIFAVEQDEEEHEH